MVTNPEGEVEQFVAVAADKVKAGAAVTVMTTGVASL
jgi:hypothetical protein